MIDERSYYLIDAYLKNRLTEEEKMEFNQYSENSEFVEEVEIQKELYVLNSERINRDELTKSQDGKLILERIKEAEDRYFNNKPKKGLVKYLSYGVAASLVLVLSFALIQNLSSKKSLESYYVENVNWDQLPSLMERVEDNNSLAKGATAFQEKRYGESVIIFTNYLKEYPNNSQVVMYLGASYLESGENTLALQTFELLTQMNTVDRSRGYWYIALIYFKNNDKSEAIKALEEIVRDSKNYNYSKAKEILTALKPE